MHILVTDVLTCPRCGPKYGLILLADRIEDRRVREGRLGCANCREMYPVREGGADLRRPGEPALGGEAVAGADRAYRVAALLGVADAPGMVLVLGGAPELVREIAALLPNAEVVGGGVPQGGPGDGVSWLALEARLPLRDRALRAAALLGGAGTDALAEVARVLAPGAHLVVDPAPAGTADSLEKMGFRALLEEEGVVVASAPGAG